MGSDGCQMRLPVECDLLLEVDFLAPLGLAFSPPDDRVLLSVFSSPLFLETFQLYMYLISFFPTAFISSDIRHPCHSNTYVYLKLSAKIAGNQRKCEQLHKAICSRFASMNVEST